MNNKKLTSVLIISVMIFAGAISITEYCRDNGSSPNNAGVTGVFGRATEKQKEIYSIVFDAQKSSMNMIKQGVNGRDVNSKS